MVSSPSLSASLLGGTPDVITFSNYCPRGKLYVTCELVGTDDQIPNERGQYELAVCEPEPEDWALNIILKLAYYTLETPLEHGQTMDIASAVPRGSSIAAFLFKRIAEYEVAGKPANIICCVGITKKELRYCFKYGHGSLLERIPTDYIVTETRRKSFV